METDKNPQVTVLFNGYSTETDTHMLANCTSTLIKGQTNIIIDTMTSWDGDKLQQALLENSIKCNDINYVICTHGHSDHIGCNYLFPNAKHIVGYSISHKDKYYYHDFKTEEFIINESVKIIATPGHTLQDISVIVTTSLGTIAITGDLFEKEEDLFDDNIWKSAGSDCEELQIKNRNKIFKLADFIIPGHGPMFKVQK